MHLKKMKKEQGASAVEFAIVLPLLTVLIFGMIEFSVALYDKAMLTNAAREGARAGIVYAPTRLTYNEVKQVVLNYSQAHLVTFGTNNPPVVDAAADPSALASGDSLTVRVTYHYDYLLLPNFIAGLTGGINMEAVAVMRME